MKQFLATTKDPLTNNPSCYYNLVTTGFYTPDPAETNVKKLIDPITVTGANFPQDTPTRFLISIPGVPDYSGAFDPTSGRTWSVKVYRPSTAAFTVFTLVAQSVTLGANQCKIFSGVNIENCAVMEFHNGSIAVDDMVYIDGYFVNTIMNVGEANAMMKGVTTVVIASSDSYVNSKINADHLIDTSDDAGAKINAILADLHAAGYGGKMIFLEGNYNFTTYINVNIDNTFEFEGISAIFNRAANINYIFYITDGTVKKISGIEIDGKDATYNTGTKYGIYCTRDNLLIENCNIHDNYSGNVYLTGDNNIIEKNNIHDSANGFGIYMASNIYNHVINNYIYNNAGNGITLDSLSLYNLCISNHIYNNTLCGIEIFSDNNKISDNYIYNNSIGVFINGNAADYSHINNNHIEANTNEAIKISGGDFSWILGNQCFNNNYGIHLLTGSLDNIIQSNVLDTNTTDSILLDVGALGNYMIYNKAADIIDNNGSATTNVETGNY